MEYDSALIVGLVLFTLGMTVKNQRCIRRVELAVVKNKKRIKK